MIVRFKKLRPDAVAPYQATEGAAGFDLTCLCSGWIPGRWQYIYHTGIAVEIPKGHVGLLFPRSSISKTQARVANAVGVIDSDYRGEITMVCDVKTNAEVYKPGDRIGQLVIVPVPSVTFEEAEELSDTARGTGGYGSTGR